MLLKKFLMCLMYLCKNLSWYYLCSLKTVSRVFSLYSRVLIDMFCIECFLYQNRSFIKDTVCEISKNGYSKKFSSNVTKFEIFHYSNNNATVIEDSQILSTKRAFKDVIVREMPRLKYV